MRENRSVSREAYYTLIVLYALLICFGALGNILVVLAVLRKAAMKTARNLFILNLAVSDLLLCLVTMPLTLLEILSRYWPLGGDTTFLCKLFGGLTGVSEFVSSMSITAIALDRYQVIVYPTRNSLQLVEVCIILACIWTLATLLASPMFVVRELQTASVNETLPGMPTTFYYCVEEWTVENGSTYYSIFSMVCQYVVPIVTVSIAYARITKKLRFRMSSMANRTSSLRQGREQRTRRTHTLLIAISLIYAISWVAAERVQPGRRPHLLQHTGGHLAHHLRRLPHDPDDVGLLQSHSVRVAQRQFPEGVCGAGAQCAAVPVL